MKKSKLWLVVVALLVFSIGMSSCSRFKKGDGKKGAVNIACNLPMTGGLGIYGESVKQGVELALDDIKKSDPNAPVLNFDWKDNTGDPKNTISIMQQQYLGNVDIYVSGVKPQTMAIKDQIDSKGTPHFVWIFDPFINTKSQNNFRTWVSYKVEPPVYLGYVDQMKAKRIAIIYVQLPHTLAEVDQILVPELKKRGINDIFIEPYDFSKNDFKDIAAKVKKFNPDLIIMNGFMDNLVGMVRAFRPQNLIHDGNAIATYDMLDASKLLGPDELEGIRVVAPKFETRPDAPGVKEWREKFKAKYNKEPLFTHPYAYDMALIINAAVKRLKLPATSEQWIEAIKATDIPGITGQLKFDKDGDLISSSEVGVFKNGKLLPLNE